MKGIVITTTGDIRIEEYKRPLYQTVGKTIGGNIEHVRPRGLPAPYCMFVNDEGALQDLPVNMVGTELYNAPFLDEDADDSWNKIKQMADFVVTIEHKKLEDGRIPICGDIVIMRDGFGSDGPDIFGIEEVFLPVLFSWFKFAFNLKGELK